MNYFLTETTTTNKEIVLNFGKKKSLTAEDIISIARIIEAKNVPDNATVVNNGHGVVTIRYTVNV